MSGRHHRIGWTTSFGLTGRDDRNTQESGFEEGERCEGGILPAVRNHRTPTAGETPVDTAASSLDCPTAIAAQNRCRSSRRAAGGRPSEPSAPRPARVERRFRVLITTPSIEVLRRPLESTQYLSSRYTERLAEAGIVPSVGSRGDSYDNALAETVIGLFKTEVIRRHTPGAVSKTLSSPPSNGSGGSTTIVSWTPSDMFRRLSMRRHSTVTRPNRLSWRHSRNELSGEAGAVHSVRPRDGFATPLLSALSSRSAPCSSLRSLRPSSGRTFTSGPSPMLGNRDRG
jgi:hypothetical protein